MKVLKCPCGVDLVETYNPNSDHHQGWLCWYVDKCADNVERSWFIFVMCETCHNLNALSLKHDRRLVRKPLEYFAGRIGESGPQSILCQHGWMPRAMEERKDIERVLSRMAPSQRSQSESP